MPTTEADVPLIDVVAGVIFDASGTQLLLALRKPEQHQGDRWEFPGGKFEANESSDAALCRELDEEIGIVPIAWNHRLTLEHSYSDKSVRLHFVDVTSFSGEPVGREGQTLRWTAIHELAGMRFPAANQRVVDELLDQLATGTGK